MSWGGNFIVLWWLQGGIVQELSFSKFSSGMWVQPHFGGLGHWLPIRTSIRIFHQCSWLHECGPWFVFWPNLCEYLVPSKWSNECHIDRTHWGLQECGSLVKFGEKTGFSTSQGNLRGVLLPYPNKAYSPASFGKRAMYNNQLADKKKFTWPW